MSPKYISIWIGMMFLSLYEINWCSTHKFSHFILEQKIRFHPQFVLIWKPSFLESMIKSWPLIIEILKNLWKIYQPIYVHNTYLFFHCIEANKRAMGGGHHEEKGGGSAAEEQPLAFGGAEEARRGKAYFQGH